MDRWRWWAAAAMLSLPLAACQSLDAPLPAHYSPAPAPLVEDVPVQPTAPVPSPAPSSSDKPMPINLASALQLAGARPLDVALAAERVQVAAAQLDRARVLWLPTIYLGADYFRHDGRIQDIIGSTLTTSRSAFMVGAAPVAVFAVTDAVFGPLAARQVAHAREAEARAAGNDALLAVAEAYFNVQQARGELAGNLESARLAAEVAGKAEDLAKGGLAPPVEVARSRAETSRRRQAAESARERWRTASAELSRVLRLDPAALVEPQEPPHLRVDLVGLRCPVEELIDVALTSRPELAARQALVQAAIQRVRQEKLRPFIPSVLLRGASTNPAGTLGVGVFGSGRNSFVGNFGARGDIDFQLLWELQNLGFGNRARTRESEAENRQAVLELLRTKERIAAEVVQAHAQVQAAAIRLKDAEAGLKDATEAASKSVEGMGQTRTAGGAVLLVIRPQEVVASVQSLALAYTDYYGATADFSRAQFRLYRALGQPGHTIEMRTLAASPPQDAPAPAGAAGKPPGELPR